MAAIFSPQLNEFVKLGAKHCGLAAGYSLVMDVTATRRANLHALVERLQGKPGRTTKREAAIELDLGASFLSQLLAGKKMGDDVARKIEIAQDLPHGWMDQPHDGDSPSVGHSVLTSHPLRIAPETISASIKLVRLSFEMLGVEYDPEEDGVPVAFAYEYLAGRKERLVTPENLVDFSKALAIRLKEQQGDDQLQAGIAGGAGGGHRKPGQKRKAS